MPHHSSQNPPLGRSFWTVWAAGAVNNVGNGALGVGVSLFAADLTSDARIMASVAAAATLPWALVSIPAGVLADRTDPILILRIAQLAQATAMTALAVLVGLHVATTAELAVLAFFATAGDVVYNIAGQSMLPRLVPIASLTRANTLLFLAQVIGFTLVGQSLGGMLFASSSASPFVFEAVSYIACTLILLSVRGQPPRWLGADGITGEGSFVRVRRETADGFRWLLRHRLLRVLTVLLGLNTFANQIAMSVFVLFATSTLGLSHAEYGWVVGASAAGSLLGGLVNTRIVRIIGAPAAIVAALTLNAACFAGLALATSAIVATALLATVGLSITVWNVVSVTMRQTLVPQGLLGRVNSINRLVGWGLLPVGALVGGVLANSFGLRAPFLIAGGFRFALLLAALPMLLPALRSLRTAPPSE